MLKGAVIGVGYLGNFHAQKYKALSQELGFQFAGVCDSSPSQAQKIAGELGVSFFTRPEELIGKVDFVTIATSTPYHFEIAKFLLQKKIHVNVEKPMTETVKEGEELIRLAKENSVLLAVGQSERFSPVLALMRAKAKNIQAVELQRHATYKTRGAEVSVILDLMIHDLDLMLSLDQSPVRLLTSARGKLLSPSDDWVQASFAFESGLRAQISVSRTAQVMTRTMKMITSEQVLIGNFQTNDIEIGSKSNDGMNFEVVNSGKGDNLLQENRNFILSLMGKEKLQVPGEQGLRALRLAQEILES